MKQELPQPKAMAHPHKEPFDLRREFSDGAGKGDKPINNFGSRWDRNFDQIENFGYKPYWLKQLEEEQEDV
jgi:hypothetical protein